MQLILSKLNNNKVCSFIFKYKIFFVISLISIFLFLSGFWYPFYFFASAVAIVFYLFSKPTDILCLLMFSEMFSVVQHYFMIGQIAGVVSLLIHYIIDVVKKRKKVAVIPLALTLFILVCYSLIHYRIDQNGIIQGLNIIFVLVGTYLIFVMNKDIDILKSLKFLTLGLLVSIVLSLFSLAFSNYSFDVAPFDGVYYRLKLFTYHTNYLSMLCLFLISFSVYKIANKKDKFLFNISEIILCLVVGILTLSKAFLVVFVGIVCYVLILLIIKFKKKSLRVILPVLAGIAILCFIFNDFVIDMLERFLAYNKNNSLINQITTGRSAIWQLYVNDIRSSVLKMLFGVGLFTADLIDIGSHNTYLFVVHRFGFIGVILLCLLAYSYLKSKETKFDISFKKLLPLFVFLVLGLEETILTDRFFVFLMFAIIVLLDEKESSKIDKSYLKIDEMLNK